MLYIYIFHHNPISHVFSLRLDWPSSFRAACSTSQAICQRPAFPQALITALHVITSRRHSGGNGLGMETMQLMDWNNGSYIKFMRYWLFMAVSWLFLGCFLAVSWLLYACLWSFLGSWSCLDGSDAVLLSNVWPVESGVNDAVYHVSSLRDDLCHSIESCLVNKNSPLLDSYNPQYP